jgi:hypothetical protein
VHVLESLADLPHVAGNLALGDLALLLDLHEGPVGHDLQDEVDEAVVVEEPVQRRQVSVLEEGLDLYFSNQVFLQLHLH